MDKGDENRVINVIKIQSPSGVHYAQPAFSPARGSLFGESTLPACIASLTRPADRKEQWNHRWRT